jgi:hypothetical protein
LSKRPVAGDAPNLSAGTEILRELLAIERERLKVAREIEERRAVVFPETSVIVRDIERLVLEIEKREREQSPTDPSRPAPEWKRW